MRTQGKKQRRIPEFASESERDSFYRNQALHFLDFKMRTESEVRMHLKEKQCPQETADEVLEFLKEYHYVDDARYALLFVRQERDLHHRSRKDITGRLLTKGIDGEHIETAFEEAGADEETEQEMARWHLDKKLRSESCSAEKLMAFLERKGFSYRTIRVVLQETEESLQQDDEYPMEDV